MCYTGSHSTSISEVFLDIYNIKRERESVECGLWAWPMGQRRIQLYIYVCVCVVYTELIEHRIHIRSGQQLKSYNSFLGRQRKALKTLWILSQIFRSFELKGCDRVVQIDRERERYTEIEIEIEVQIETDRERESSVVVCSMALKTREMYFNLQCVLRKVEHFIWCLLKELNQFSFLHGKNKNNDMWLGVG